MPVAAKREHQFHLWNQDGRPILDAVDAAEALATAAGYVAGRSMSIGLGWPDADANEESTQDARRALLGAAPLTSVHVWASWYDMADDGTSIDMEIEVTDPDWIYVTMHGHDVDLLEPVHEAVVEHLARAAHAKSKLSVPKPKAGKVIGATHRSGIVGWIEDHPALSVSIATLAAAVIAAIITAAA